VCDCTLKSLAFVLLENKGWMVTGDWPRSRYELGVKESGFGKNLSCRRLRERWGRTRGSKFEEASFFSQLQRAVLRYSFYSSVPGDCNEPSKDRRCTSYIGSRESIPAVISGRMEIDVTAHSQIFKYLRDAKLASQGRCVQLLF
jgi:hypothetical protein